MAASIAPRPGSATGSPPTAVPDRPGEGGFKAEPGRYHLYVSLACPWAHRTLIMRRLKRLEDAIGVSVVHWHMDRDGWEFREGPGATGDRLHGLDYLHQVYTRARPDYTGRVSVPVLWDKRAADDRQQRVGRDHPHAQLGLRSRSAPTARTSIRRRCGRRSMRSTIASTTRSTTASTRPASRAPRRPTRKRRGRCSRRSTTSRRCSRAQRYLAGDRITEADWRLFTTLVRFDPVYVGHFKCNLRRLVDYPNLWAYARELYQVPGVAGTVDFHHIKQHYYGSHRSVNPTGIVPIGPVIDWSEPHGRG